MAKEKKGSNRTAVNPSFEWKRPEPVNARERYQFCHTLQFANNVPRPFKPQHNFGTDSPGAKLACGFEGLSKHESMNAIMNHSSMRSPSIVGGVRGHGKKG